MHDSTLWISGYLGTLYSEQQTIYMNHSGHSRTLTYRSECHSYYYVLSFGSLLRLYSVQAVAVPLRVHSDNCLQ